MDGNRGGNVEKEDVKGRSCIVGPFDYIVAQINRSSTDSLESSCSAGEESSHSRALRSSQERDGMGPSCLFAVSQHLHDQINEKKSRLKSTFTIFCALTDYKMPSLCGSINVNLNSNKNELGFKRKRKRVLQFWCFLMMMKGYPSGVK